jgi:CBS domain-containing protein
MEHNDEMLYILGADGKVYGIVSRGDLYRYYENQMNRLNINQKFQAISSQDYIAAEEIFQKIDTIHEVPVVNNGELMGVIRYKTTKNRNDWEVYKRRLARIRERFLS